MNQERVSATRLRWILYALMSVILIVDILFPRGYVPGVLYITLLVFTHIQRAPHLTWQVATLSTMLILTGFVLSPPGASFWLSVSNRILAVAMVWIVTLLIKQVDQAEDARARAEAAYRENLEQQNTALQSEIEERKRLEALVQSERDLLQVTLTSLGDGVVAVDATGALMFMNPVAERITGWRQHEACGRHIDELLPLINDVTRHPVRNPVIRALQEGAVVALENHTLLLSRSGREVPLADSGAPIRNAHGQVLGAVMVLRDVTAEKAAEQALRQAKEAAEAANQVKDAFLASMSHELRTPLNVMLGYSELLDDGEFGQLTDAQTQALRRARRAAVQLHELIASILDLHRLADGQLSLQLQEVSLTQLLADMREEVQGLQERAAVPIQWRVDDVLPSIVTDSGRVKIILKNLINNAVKYTVTGIITVDVHNHEDGVEFTVTDTGIGIAPEHLELIFAPFRQIQQPVTGPVGGVGLGLYLAKQFVELLGGTVTVKSAIGRGSTFRVWLPKQSAEAGVSLVSEKREAESMPLRAYRNK
ncbi:MAG: ATP-binding protein [Candidatus Binatia bacterium]